MSANVGRGRWGEGGRGRVEGGEQMDFSYTLLVCTLLRGDNTGKSTFTCTYIIKTGRKKLMRPAMGSGTVQVLT